LEHVLSSLYTVSLFGIGAVVMRGAGCTINDLWDRRYDQHVARTKDRPLVNGSVTPKQALQFVLVQSSIGLCVLLSLQPHILDCIYWGCLSLPLVILYPTMKRFFWYPQLVLGMTFNWGAILGWVAVHGSSGIDWTIVAPLYGSGISWTLIYDTLYAHQDKKDDAILKLHSTALSFGPSDERQRVILHCLAALTWSQWLLVGYSAFDTYTAFFPYYSAGVTMAYSHLVWQIQTADFDNPCNLANRFRSNNTTGAIVAGAISTALAAQVIS
jgi:4-hydroxybenzoate polyprenyltransferase